VARRHRVERERDGTVRLRLPLEERTVLRSTVTQLRALVASDDDESLTRLYPTAYAHDPEADAEYRALMHGDLVDHRKAAIEAVLASVDNDVLDAEQTSAWMGVINDIRLVLGTRLDITETLDFDDIAADNPDIASYALYGYLSWLLEQFVQAIDDY
jgi:hypothetical protein